MVRATYAVQISFNAVEAFGKLQPVTWTTVTDVVREEGITVRRGISGTSPADRIAGPGTLSFSLRNDAGNSGGVLGYYSPGHASVRTGFDFGMPCRLIATYAATPYTLFTGRIRTIDPDAGTYRSRRVHVTVQDCVGDLVDARLTDIDAQIDEVEFTIATAIADAIPAAVRPVWVQHGGGDVYGYALDDLGEGRSVLAAIGRVARSSAAKVYADPDNELHYRSRQNLAAQASQYTFVETELDDVQGPTSLDHIYNRVRVTVHPRHADDDAPATTVLFAINNPVAIEPFESVVVWGTYRDPLNTGKLIGGRDFEAFTATTDVLANSAEDGGGTDLTAQISGTAETFATTVKYDVANNTNTVRVYLTRLQTRGNGIYADAPVTVESFEADSTIGDQTIELDMPYQNDANLAQDYADYVRVTAGSRSPTSITIDPQRSNAVMLQALQRDVCDVVSVTEPLRAFTTARGMIHGIEWSINAIELASCTWTLAPFASVQAWILDDAAYSILDSTTILGYAA